MIHRRRGIVSAGLTTAVLVVSGCSAQHDEQSEDPLAAAPAQVLGGRLPPSSEASAPLGALDLPFDDPPTVVGNVLVGPVYPDHTDDRLRFIAVSSGGELEWEVSTNPSCVGYAVSQIDSGAAVTILQSDASIDEGRLATQVAASSYDVESGVTVWGPEPVPGSLVAAGLVFGQPTNAVVGASTGTREVLDGATGHQLVDIPDGTAVVERDGLVLLDDDSGAVVAQEARTESMVWSSTSTRPASVPAVATAGLVSDGLASGAAVTIIRWVWPRNPDGVVSLHRTSDGAVLGQPLQAQPMSLAADTAGDTAAVVLPDGDLVGLSVSGAMWIDAPVSAWSQPALSPSGDDLVVLDGDEVVELDPGSGAETSRSAGAAVLAITADGGRVVQGQDGVLLLPSAV